MRITIVHMHDVGHESKSGQLIGELAPEEPEICERWIGSLEVFEGDCTRNPFLLNSSEGLHAQILDLIRVFLFHIVSAGGV